MATAYSHTYHYFFALYLGRRPFPLMELNPPPYDPKSPSLDIWDVMTDQILYLNKIKLRF